MIPDIVHLFTMTVPKIHDEIVSFEFVNSNIQLTGFEILVQHELVSHRMGVRLASGGVVPITKKNQYNRQAYTP